MTFSDLRAEAAKVLAIRPAEGFAHETFSLGSGGAPRNDAGVPEVHRESRFVYSTVRHGGPMPAP